jgi:hypothetical protein
MKKTILIFGTIIILIAVGLSGCIEVSTKNFKEDYDANENTLLKISNINGKIEINSWTGDTVKLDAVISSHIGKNELENIEIDVNENNNIIDIETKYLGDGLVEVTTNMNLEIPNFVTVDTIATSNGDVHISNVIGNISADSSNGDLKIENVDGYISASTSNGKIEIKDTTGIKNIDSSNGDIYTEIFDFQENITIHSSNGEINVYINPSLNANLSMTTSNGDVSISDLSLDLDISEEDHKSGILGIGGYSIIISTSNGDINLFKLNV